MIAVWWMADRGLTRPAWAAVAVVIALAGSCADQGHHRGVLVPVAAASAYLRLGSLPAAAARPDLGGVLAFSLYAVAMLINFMPTFLSRADAGPAGYLYPTWWFIARDPRLWH